MLRLSRHLSLFLALFFIESSLLLEANASGLTGDTEREGKPYILVSNQSVGELIRYATQRGFGQTLAYDALVRARDILSSHDDLYVAFDGEASNCAFYFEPIADRKEANPIVPTGTFPRQDGITCRNLKLALGGLVVKYKTTAQSVEGSSKFAIEMKNFSPLTTNDLPENAIAVELSDKNSFNMSSANPGLARSTDGKHLGTLYPVGSDTDIYILEASNSAAYEAVFQALASGAIETAVAVPSGTDLASVIVVDVDTGGDPVLEFLKRFDAGVDDLPDFFREAFGL